MSKHRCPAASTDPARDPDAEKARTRALQMMVLGAVLAVLGPLGGFLAGSMIGPAQQLGEYDAMYIAMVVGLGVGPFTRPGRLGAPQRTAQPRQDVRGAEALLLT